MSVEFNPKRYEDPFISDLVGFVAADEFQTLFEQFFLTFAIEFTDDEEHKLRYTEIYNDFHHLFEEQLETFCHSKGFTHAEFMRKCSTASTDDEKAKHYIEILLASSEYNTFVRLMRIMRPVALQRLSKNSEAKSSGAEIAPTAPSKGELSRQESVKASKDIDVEFDRLEVADAKQNYDDEYVSPSKTTYDNRDERSMDKDYGEKY